MKIRQATRLLVALLFVIQGAQAETYTWLLNTTGTWSNTAAWSPTAPVGGPGASDDIISSGTSGSPALLLTGTNTVNNVIKNNAGGNWVIGGGSVASVLNANSISNSVGNTIIRNFTAAGLSVNVVNVTIASGGLYFGAASSSQAQYLNGLNVTGTFTMTGGVANINIDNATDTYSLGLVSMSSGTMNLSQSNNATNKQYVTNVTGLTGSGGIINGYGTVTQGSTTNSGTIAINNSGDFVSGASIRDYVVSATLPMQGPLSIVKSGTGTQALTGANTYTGDTVINEGTLKIGNGSTTGSITSNVIMTSTTATFGIDRSNTGTFANTITGSGRLLKQGGGVFLLTGTNTYTGDTVIENGGIQVMGDENLGGVGSNIVFNNGANVARIETAQTATIARNIAINGTQIRIGTTGPGNLSTFSGVISGTGGVDKRFVGTLILTNANTYSGGTVITTGTLAAQNSTGSATGTGSLTVNANMALAGNGIIAPDAGNNISVAGIIAPGLDSTATLTFGLSGASKLDFTSGSAINMTLGTSSDLIDFSTAGDWLSGTGLATLNLTLGDGFSYSNSYVIFSDVTTAAFTLAGITGYDTDSYTANFAQVGNNYQVSFEAIPEPSTWMLLGCGLAVVLWRVQRRKATR